MILTVRRLSAFKRDYKRCVRRGYNIEKLQGIIELLANKKKLEPKHRDHSLLGEYRDCRECHVEPDWLLIYQVTSDELILIRTGTHSDLFE